MVMFPDLVGTRREFLPRYSDEQIGVSENRSQRARLWLLPRWEIPVSYADLSSTDAALIDSHILEVNGAADPWYWCDWTERAWMWVPIAIADGAATTFDLPGIEVSEIAVFVGASSVTATVTEGAGTDGVATVTVTSGGTPATGLWVWCNARMRRVFSVRFDRDPVGMAERDLETGLFRFSARLLSEKNGVWG